MGGLVGWLVGWLVGCALLLFVWLACFALLCWPATLNRSRVEHQKLNQTAPDVAVWSSFWCSTRSPWLGLSLPGLRDLLGLLVGLLFAYSICLACLFCGLLTLLGLLDLRSLLYLLCLLDLLGLIELRRLLVLLVLLHFLS